jgi:hypothetical protein
LKHHFAELCKKTKHGSIRVNDDVDAAADYDIGDDEGEDRGEDVDTIG